MEYIILVGVALIRRWLNIVGYQVVNAVFLAAVVLIALCYLGYVFFVDGDE